MEKARIALLPGDGIGKEVLAVGEALLDKLKTKRGLPIETVPQLSVHELEQWLHDGREVDVIDVREPAEWTEGHVAGAMHVPMLEAVRRRDELATPRAKAVVCAGGLRSSAVISALKRHGLTNFYNVTGGMAAWTKAGYAIQRSS